MTNYREILRLNKLGISKAQIAAGCGCARSTIQRVLQRAEMCNLTYPLPEEMTDRHLAEALFPSVGETVDYKLPDCEYVHREMAKSGVTLNLLWLEYCEQCRTANEISYQLTQFKKYYRDFVVSTKATMHINHKPGELMQVDWAGDTAHVINTDTGEFITAYILQFAALSRRPAMLLTQRQYESAHSMPPIRRAENLNRNQEQRFGSVPFCESIRCNHVSF